MLFVYNSLSSNETLSVIGPPPILKHLLREFLPLPRGRVKLKSALGKEAGAAREGRVLSLTSFSFAVARPSSLWLTPIEFRGSPDR